MFQTTFAWGSPDIMMIFDMKSNNRNIRTFSYDNTLQDFSGSHSTIAVDTWVFDNVERFLKERHDKLQLENETVYFLHLLGLDTAGHTHKPNTKYERLFYLSLESVTKILGYLLIT